MNNNIYNPHYPSISKLFFSFLFILISIPSTLSFSSEIDDYILYFDEWRYDWDHVNDFDNDYHDDWEQLIDSNKNNYGCTNNLQTINKKLCILHTDDGDFTFKFKNINNNNNNIKHSNLENSNIISSAKALSNYYDNIELKFDNDQYWSSIKSIDGINGYEAIKKCQPLPFVEICAIYNPYSDNLNIHTKLANYKRRRLHNKYKKNKLLISNANQLQDDDIYDDNDDEAEEEETISIDEAMSFATKDYDDTLGYAYWRDEELGWTQFDDHSDNIISKGFNNYDNDNKYSDTYGGHSYYFNEMSFDWDDSRDWISFAKSTNMDTNMETEEVGAHPDKLEVSKSDTKIIANSGKLSETGLDTSSITPSRTYTKCTGAIPFIHKHACVSIDNNNAHLQFKSAKQQEINMLYNAFDDILNDYQQIEQEQQQEEEEAQSDEEEINIDNIDNAYNDINNDYDEYEYDSDIDSDSDHRRRSRRRDIRRLKSLYDNNFDNIKFSFNDDNDWDEITYSYGFDNKNEQEYGRYGSKRMKQINNNNIDSDSDPSSAFRGIINMIRSRALRPKLLLHAVPFLFPSVRKCIHTSVISFCFNFDMHSKKMQLHIGMPRLDTVMKCVRDPMACLPTQMIKNTGKRLFNGAKKALIIVRQIGQKKNNPYKKKRKKHCLCNALKQIRKIKKQLNHLTRSIKQAMRDNANQISDNIYGDLESDEMQEKLFDVNDERGLLLFAERGTNDFNDIWDDNDQWNNIEQMETWEGQQITRKCLTIWKKRLCLCQFLGWLDGPEKYHCLFPHHEYFDKEQQQAPSMPSMKPLHVKRLSPRIREHQFHKVYAAHIIDNDMDILPNDKPEWLPLWMWQEIKDKQQNKQIAKHLYSSANSLDDDNNDNEYYDDINYDFNVNNDYESEYEDALNEYYSNEYDYYQDITNLNINNEDNDDNEEESESEYFNREDAWIEMSESATHDFDNEWDNDESWDDIMEMKTWEGTTIRRKCMKLWKHRLCLCQFLGWMDSNKYQCLFHKRNFINYPQTHVQRRIKNRRMRRQRMFGANRSPNTILHGYPGPRQTHFIERGAGNIRRKGPVFHHQFHHYGPLKGKKRSTVHVYGNSKSNTIGMKLNGNKELKEEPKGFNQGLKLEKEPNKRGPGPQIYTDDDVSEGEGGNPLEGEMQREIAEKRREEAERMREMAEKKRETHFSDIKWKDKENHQAWALMKEPHHDIIKKTASGQKLIVAQHINPHGKPIMISMHKHMPDDRPQWMPAGLFTNLQHRHYYMVHGDGKHGGAGMKSHETITPDENRFHSGSDIVPQFASNMDEYDLYENYYYIDNDDNDDYYYDDEYYHYNIDDYDTYFDLNKIYNDDNDNNKLVDYMDEFVDSMNNEWVISEVASSLSKAFNNLFSNLNNKVNENEYWDSIEDIKTMKGFGMKKKCMNIFGKEECLCQHEGLSNIHNKKHYHCNEKMNYRHKHYLDTKMPKETPQWMSAHDFEWLKDERLAALPHILPDPLVKHIEYHQLYTIPFNTLTELILPAIKMEHITWHKGNNNNNNNNNAFGAKLNVFNNYYSNNYYDYNMYNQQEEEEEDNGYYNEYGDYIIDTFYNELDSSQWVITNEWTTENELDNDNKLDDETVFSATTHTAKESDNDGRTVTTTPERILSSRCMQIFGRNICLCEFINWVYDKNNPLYKCYAETPQLPTPGGGFSVMQPKFGPTNNNPNQYTNPQNGGIQQQNPVLNNIQNNNNNNGGNPQSNPVAYLEQMQNQLATVKQQLAQMEQKNQQAAGSNIAAKQAKEEANEKQSTANSQGWSNSFIQEGDKDQQYYRFDYYYDKDNDNDNDINDINNDIEYDDDDDDEEDVNDNIIINIEPNWRTEGVGFTQTVYIGINTFFGLMLISLFFGMISCSFICCYYHFSRLLCPNKNKLNNHYYSNNNDGIDFNYETDNTMISDIQENHNVVNKINNNNDE